MEHLSNKDILIGSIQSWDFALLSKHYLTLELAKLQNNITFVHNQRISKILFPDAKSNAFTFHNLMPDTLTLSELYLSPRLARSRLLQSIAMTFIRRTLGSTYYPDVIFSFDPVFYVLHEMYPDAVKIYYCVDYLTGKTVKANAEQRLLSVSDIVIVSSSRLYEHLRTKHSNVHYIPHGVNLLTEYHDELLNQHIDQLFPQKNNKPVFGFLGHINDRVDFDLIDFIARRNPQCTIVLIGTQAPRIVHKLRQLPTNVFYPGPVPARGIKYCLGHFDVGIVPYICSEFNLMSHPIKLLQYISAGLPVVCTTVGEDFTQSKFIYECSGYDEFNRKVVEAYELNSGDLGKERLRYAQEHSWESRTKQISQIIEKLLSP